MPSGAATAGRRAVGHPAARRRSPIRAPRRRRPRPAIASPVTASARAKTPWLVGRRRRRGRHCRDRRRHRRVLREPRRQSPRRSNQTARADAAGAPPRRRRPATAPRRRQLRRAAGAGASRRDAGAAGSRRRRRQVQRPAGTPARPRPAARSRAAKPGAEAAAAAAPRRSPSRDAEAAQRLEVARAKIANNLNDQALADLRQIVIDYPGSRAGAEAAFLAGGAAREDRPARRRDGGVRRVREPLRRRSRAPPTAKLRRAAHPRPLSASREPQAAVARAAERGRPRLPRHAAGAAGAADQAAGSRPIARTCARSIRCSRSKCRRSMVDAADASSSSSRTRRRRWPRATGWR